MALNYKNIVITPNIGNTADPKIVFSGGNTTVNTDISMFVYPSSNGTLSFEGSAGQLFSVTNDLSGSLFSVNDVSGLPSLEIFANGQINLAPYGGNVVFGNTSSSLFFNPYFSSNINFTDAGVTRFISTAANNSLTFRIGTTGQGGYGTRDMALSVQGGGYVRVDYSGGGTYHYDTYGSYWHMGYAGMVFNNAGGNGATSPVTFQGVNFVTATTSFRAPIFYDSNDTGFYLDPASTTTSLQIAGAIEQGNNIARPNIEWQAQGASTGMVIFSLPGAAANYGMVHMVFDIYEYVTGKTSTVIVGGHNWNSSWYQTGCQVIGNLDKTVRLGFKDGKYCVVFGGAASTWTYGTIRLRKIHNGGFYNNIMDLGGAYTTTQTTTESFTAVTADLRQLRTPGTFQADGDIRTPIFYDSNNTAFYVDPASGSLLKRLFVDATNVDPSEVSGVAFGNIYEPTTGWSAPGIAFGVGAGSHGAIGYGSGLMYFATENGSDNTLNSRMTLTSGGVLSVTGDVRAPIFYDSANTTFYVDPGGSTSAYLNGDIFVSQGKITINRGPDSFTSYVEDDSSSLRAQLLLQSDYSDIVIMSREANANRHGSTLTFATQSTANTDYAKWVIGQGQYQEGANQLAFAYGVNNANPHIILGTDNANYSFLIQSGGLTYSSVATYAPIFYDLNNSAYYLDPATTSVLNLVYSKGNEVLTKNFNTTVGSGGWDLNGNFAFQKIYSDHSPFNNEAVYNVAFYRGNTWTLYGWNGSVWTNLGNVANITDGKLSTITLSRTYSEFIIDMGTTLGYCYMSALTCIHSTNGNSFALYFEKSTSSTYNTGAWTAMTSLTGINSWPGGTSLKFADAVGGPFDAYTRIRIVPTWSHASNNIDFGGLTISAHYGPRNQLMTWDTVSNITAYGSFRAPIFYDSNDTTYYLDPASTSNLNTVQAADAFRSDRFEDLSGAFFFREGLTSGTARHLNLSDTTADPGGISADVGITWGQRTDNNPYYLIWTTNYNNGVSTHSRLRLGWHTGIELGSDPVYGGIRFFNNSPGIVGAAELMSIGKSDTHVRVNNNLYAKIYYDIDNTAYYVNPAEGTTSAILNGKVGIGTTSPTYKLDIQDISNPTFGVSYTGGNTNTGGATLYIHGNRTGTGGAVGEIQFVNTQGANLFVSTVVSRIRSWWESTGNMAIGFEAGGTEKMRISANGNLGLGTTGPGYKLDVVGTGDVTAGVTSSSGGAAIYRMVAANSALAAFNQIQSLYSGTVNWSIGGDGVENALAIKTGGSDRIRIAANGNIGIANATPAHTLRVEGNTSISSSLEAGGGVITSGSIVIRGGGATGEGAQIVFGYGNNLASSITTQANNTFNLDVVGGNTASTPIFRLFAQHNNGTSTGIFAMANTGRIHFGSTAEQTDATVKVTGTLWTTGNLTVASGINANGSLGTAGQVLTTNGTTAYWAPSSVTRSSAIAMSILFG